MKIYRSWRSVLLGIILFFASQTVSAEILLSCEQPKVAGLYKQCQEVSLLQVVGDRARVFGRVDKKVSLVELKLVFIARALGANEAIHQNSLISIPGTLLWNNSPEGYQSLCLVTGHSSKLLNVSCGRRKDEVIARQNAFVLNPFSAAAIKPTSISR